MASLFASSDALMGECDADASELLQSGRIGVRSRRSCARGCRHWSGAGPARLSAAPTRSFHGAEMPWTSPVTLVDTSVWIEHLRADARLVELLGDDEAGCHPLVIEELALGLIKQRDVVLDLLANLCEAAHETNQIHCYA